MTKENVLGIGVIGAGAWGRNHVETFSKLGGLAAVADASCEQLIACGRKYPGIQLYSNYKDLISDELVTGVVIASPAPLHAEMACEAMRHGKHVLVEKPMTLCSQDAKQLITVAKDTGCVLMVGHLLLYDPLVLSMHQAIQDGLIGEVHSIHLERCKLGRVRRVENVLWSFGVHDLAVLLHLTSLSCKVESVACQSILQQNIEDDVYVHMSLGTNVSAHLHVSWLWPLQRRMTTVIGSEGMMVYDEIGRSLTVHRQGINNELEVFDNGTVVLPPFVPFRRLFGEELHGAGMPDEKGDLTTVGALEIECRHFAACVCQGLTPLSDGCQGLEVVEILERSMKRMREGDAG